MGSKAILAVILAIALTRIAGEAQERKKFELTEQTNFSIETSIEKIEKPVPLPSGVLQLLKKDEDALESSVGCTDEGGGPDALQASWFVASEVHLGRQDEKDLVVLAANQCLNGANVGPFWVARKTKQGYQLVLSTGGHDLKILDSRSKGFRNIRRASLTAVTVSTTTYHFDGQRYQEFNSTSGPIGED